MFPSQMVRRKIVEHSQVAHFFHVSLANGKIVARKIVVKTLKWPTFSMFPSQMVRLKNGELSSGPLFSCFPRKWYALKLSKPQVAHFFHVSLANGTTNPLPKNGRTLKWPTFSMFQSHGTL